MDKQIYITPKLLRSRIAEEVKLDSNHYVSLFSETGLIKGFTPEEFIFKKYLESVKKLSLQLNKCDINNLSQEAINDAIFRLEVASLTQIDKENMTMKFELEKFASNQNIMKVLQVFSPNVIQYVALKHGLKLEDGTTFFANNHPKFFEKKLIPCKNVSEKELIVGIGQKLNLNQSEFLPDEKIEKITPNKNKDK